MASKEEYNMENSCRSSRGELWCKIYEIVKELKLRDIDSDSMDHPSCATKLELLFIDESCKTKKYAE